MANLNKATVRGVLGRDPETKNFPEILACRKLYRFVEFIN